MIDISKMDKADVLAALYNNSRPLGMGYLHFDPTPMTRDEASVLLKEQEHTTYNGGKSIYFDYLKGRVMKVELATNSLDPWGYDRDNGEGAAGCALAHLVQTTKE